MKNQQSMKLSMLVLACTLGLSACSTTQMASNTTNTVANTGHSFAMPAYETLTLDNGLTIKLMVRPQVPLITFNAVVKAGAVNDTSAGLANMTANSLMLGAGGKTKAQIEQELDFIGAKIVTQGAMDGSYVSSNFMSKDLQTVLPIFNDVLRHPDFNDTEFAKLQQRNVVGLAQAKESPRQVIGRYYNQLVFGEHPYANAPSGNAKSIAQMTINQLRAFHKSYYQPSNTELSVVGDFNLNEMKALLTKTFADWQNTEAVLRPDLSQNLPQLTTSRVLLVDKPDAIETTFLIGGVGVRKDNADFVGLTVVNTILGGRFTSWLNDELRVNAGLTYGARSAFVSYADAGVFRISSFTKTQTTKAAMDLALKTYSRLWEQGIDQATLDSAKAYVKGQFPPQFETNGQLAGLMSDQYIYGVDDDYINAFQARVDGLTLEQTQALVAKYFPKEKLQYVLIGNADKIRALAKQYGEVTEVAITDSGFGG
ncbi:M16 family metallopeptidase [Shewanella intestini]|uniref:Insulinase family protein n=1 Tax=Shewanella intestini TaxID=2017544 RepID=A0ABS5I3X8_9GAMM|nr:MULTISPECIES: pitrilysin family protein [Shewanella]MBR9728726.1 insulinase family protein [Shewanella intestini]MRG36802.1 insulinase family protein [Shewanella sp. XMDDZSB0408]